MNLLSVIGFAYQFDIFSNVNLCYNFPVKKKTEN